MICPLMIHIKPPKRQPKEWSGMSHSLTTKLLRTSPISLRMYGVTEATPSKHFFGGYKVYCIKNVLFYAVQSNYCIKNLFPYHSNIRKHILISFIVRWGIFLLRPIIGSTESHNLYWNRDIIKYPSS